MWWFWFFAGPALLLAFLSLRGERKRAAYVSRTACGSPPADLPPATVIVPVKGEDHGLRENLAALAAQDYPDYELIVVAHCAADIPAGALPNACARGAGARGRARHRREGAEPADRRPIRRARTRELFAFADSDGRVSRDLAARAGGAAGSRWRRAAWAPRTGYRWFAPEPPDFWSLMRSVWDAVTARHLRAWLKRLRLGRIDGHPPGNIFCHSHVPDFWRNTVSDDYALSAAVPAAGLPIVFAPGALARLRGPHPADVNSWPGRAANSPSRASIARGSGGPRWLAHFFYCGGMAAAVVASIQRQPRRRVGADRAAFAGHVKGANRATLAKAETARVQSLVRPPCLGAHAVGAAGNLDLADRAARLGDRQSDRVARQPLSVEGAPPLRGAELQSFRGGARFGVPRRT